MRQSYFVHNGIRYPTGTGIKIKVSLSDKFYSDGYFIFYDTEKQFYALKYLNRTFFYCEKDFINSFGGVNGKFNNEIHMPQKIQLKDSQIDKLVIGWFVYIAVMLGSIIFKDFISIWIFGSIYFYFWRKDVIKKEGHYVQW